MELLARDAYVTNYYQFQTDNGEVYVEELTTLSGERLEAKIVDSDEKPITDLTVKDNILKAIDNLNIGVY